MDSIDGRERIFKACVEKNAEILELNQTIGKLRREIEELRDERDHWMELAHQWEDGASTRRFAERLESAASERADVTIFGVDYVALPLDADGVPIRVGDVVAATLAHGGSGRWVVDRMELTRAYDQDLWQIALDKDGACWVTPSTVRHHRAPTVEDVLREFFSRYVTTKETKAEDDAILAEYAAKLRLAGDE